MNTSPYYNTERIDSTGALYRLIVGERSNGKTTAALQNMVKRYSEGLGNGAYLRQMDIDLRGQRGASIMRSLMFGGKNKDENLIESSSGGKYNTVKYYNRAWFLGNTFVTEGGKEDVTWEPHPFCYAFAISQMKHDKSATPANVTTIVFDEFQPADGVYLSDETVLFRNVINTIVRDARRSVIYLIANTNSWNSPYFKIFGLGKDLKRAKPGDLIEVESTKKDVQGRRLKTALEYTQSTEKTHGGKDSDVYFLFEDDHSSMITGGAFAVPNYPPCPHSFTKENVKATYWIKIDDPDEEQMIRARLMKVERDLFVFCDKVPLEVYEKLKNDTRDLFYSMEFSGTRNHYTSPLMGYADRRTEYLRDSIATNRMFFSNVEVGEDMMYYVRTSNDMNLLRM